MFRLATEPMAAALENRKIIAGLAYFVRTRVSVGSSDVEDCIQGDIEG